MQSPPECAAVYPSIWLSVVPKHALAQQVAANAAGTTAAAAAAAAGDKSPIAEPLFHISSTSRSIAQFAGSAPSATPCPPHATPLRAVKMLCRATGPTAGTRPLFPSPFPANVAPRTLRSSCTPLISLRTTHLPAFKANAPSIAGARRLSGRGVAAAAATTAPPPPATEAQLQHFLGWLVANGVEGIGQQDSKIALFSGENGERGLAAVAPLKKGESFARVPLRLAVTDDPDDAETNALFSSSADAPWSVRLGSKLLRLAADGDASPWAAYLAVLPPSVPSPFTGFEWEDVCSIAYDPARRALDRTAHMAATALADLPAGAAGPAPPAHEAFDWALSVVHSRTFGAPGRAGGVGVRMLVPLVDLLNHGGDYDAAPPAPAAPGAAPQPYPTDNVRWDIVSKIGGEFYMVLTATRDVAAGEELLLSYGERSNDDFFLHYGFVPPRNPHDDVILYESIEDAIDWHLERYLPLGGLAPNALQAAISAAYAAASAEEEAAAGGAEKAAAAEAALESMPETEAERVREERAAIKLLSRGRTDGRLVAAITSLHAAARVAGGPVAENCQEHVREAVAARAAEILRSMARGGAPRLDEDLAALAAAEAAGADSGDHGWGDLAAVYGPAIEASPWADKVGAAAASGDAAVAEAAPVDAGASSADVALLEALKAAGAAVELDVSGSSGEGGSGSAEGGDAAAPAAAVHPLARAYRAYKGLILWDALLI